MILKKKRQFPLALWSLYPQYVFVDSLNGKLIVDFGITAIQVFHPAQTVDAL